MTAEFQPHIYSDNIIDEISASLYKYPHSAIKELITNGLDQQVGSKHARIDIRFHVGPTDDIEIEDPATGVEDLEKFKVIGGGEKKVGDLISSARTRVEGISGYKGFGKIGSRMLSGSIPDPIVIWYSRREYIEDGKHKVKCLKITLLKSGYNVENLDSTDEEALKHQGCKVVIKNARYDKLPSFKELIKLMSKWYAIRIKRGTKIVFDEVPVPNPDGFDSRAFDLFQLDNGDWIKGNFRRIDSKEKTNKENVWINVNNIYVDSLRTENPCIGWINDDFLTPTTSREAIEGNERWEEVQSRLTYYLNEMYPPPESPKLGKMNSEKEKKELLKKAFQFHNKPMNGTYDKDGIIGDITAGTAGDDKAKWNKMEGVKLTNTGGNENGDPIISIGDGKKGKTGRNNGEGSKPSIDENGDDDILKRQSTKPKDKQGPIIPNWKFLESPLGTNLPMAFTMDGITFTINTSWKQSSKAWKIGGENMKYAVAPVIAQAMVNFEKQQESSNLNTEQWQQRYCDYVEAMVN